MRDFCHLCSIAVALPVSLSIGFLGCSEGGHAEIREHALGAEPRDAMWGRSWVQPVPNKARIAVAAESASGYARSSNVAQRLFAHTRAESSSGNNDRQSV